MAGTMNVLLISRGSAASPIFHGGRSGWRDDGLHMVWRGRECSRSAPVAALPGAGPREAQLCSPRARRRRGPGHRRGAAPGRARPAPVCPAASPLSPFSHTGSEEGGGCEGPECSGGGSPGDHVADSVPAMAERARPASLTAAPRVAGLAAKTSGKD